MANPRTPDMMPLRGQRYAPPTFRGGHDKITDFLTEYTQIANSYSLSDAQKVERIVRYCSSKVQKLIESLPSFTTPDWPALQAELIKLYDAARSSTRFWRTSLEKLVKSWKKKKIRSLSVWKAYVRELTTVAGWLLAKNKITADEKATFFWLGIHPSLKNIIESRLRAGATPLNVTTPFPEASITTVVEGILE